MNSIDCGTAAVLDLVSNMSRPPRPLIHGGTYHVMNRGNRKAIIFHDNRDRIRFNRIFIEAAAEHEVEIDGALQMGNHFHAVVVTPHANISAFMQQFESRYADYINWRYQLVGHLFQSRFRAVVIEDDLQFFTTMWYVFSNPCKAGFCARYEDWPWSTYAATVGLKPVPAYLSIAWLETLFPSDSLNGSQQLFRQCLEDGDPIAAYLLVVDPTLPAAIRSYISFRLHEMKDPSGYREAVRPPLDELFPRGQTKAERDVAIQRAKTIHGYTLTDIAKVVRLHPGSVSKIFSDARRRSRDRTP